MKKFSLLALCAALFFLAGCGGGGNDYDEYGDTAPSGDEDSADTAPDKDSSDTAEEPSDDADTAVQPDEDAETSDEDETDADTPSHEDFWSTCEGIIACSNGCTEDDSECIGDCYGKGSDEGQLYYRRWRECYDSMCAEDKTAECSAANCAEWDELCNVAEAFEYEISFPAPYGNAEFGGSFTYILKNSFPTSENEIQMSAFANGAVASMQLAASGTMITFVRTANDPRDGSVVEVYQAPLDKNTMKPSNPVTVLRIKADSAVKGSRNAGVTDESEARFLVADIDDRYNISCYHAFGIGSFSIDEADIVTGSQGKLKISGGKAELFSPQNIPELGGDARETLGVEACSLIW